MLKLKQLKKIYDRDDVASFVAVDSVDLNILEGDFVIITGRSGSGKSTILNMVMGLLRPTSGTVLIDGIDLWSMDDRNMANIRNSRIGYIPQGLSVLTYLTVLDNVRLPFCLANKKDNGIERAMNLLEEMRIQNLAERYPSQLSGGEIRRVAIARALVNNPEFLIADEPTSDLDEETTKEMLKFFSRIHCDGITILMVTHEYDITNYGNRLFVMSSGKLTEKKVLL